MKNIINGGALLIPVDNGGGLTITGISQDIFYAKESSQSEYENINPSYSSQYFINKNYYPIKKEQVTNVSAVTTGFESEVLNPEADKGIVGVLNGSISILPELQDSVNRINSTTIKNALKPEVQKTLFNIKYSDGRSIPESVIVQSLKSRILNKTLDKVNFSYISNLEQRTNPIPQNTETSTSSEVKYNPVVYLQNSFGRSQSDIKKERAATAARLGGITQTPPEIPNETRAIARAYEKRIPLDPSKASEENANYLKLWHILPSDIYTKIPIQEANGNVNYFYVNDDETLSIETSAGIEKLPVTPYAYDLSVINVAGGVDFVDCVNDIDRAHTLNNNIENACLYDVRSQYQTIFTVSSLATSNLEYTANLRVARPKYYVLTIDKSDIEELPSSDFVRKTRVKYNLLSNENEIQAAIDQKVFPWQVLPINHNDPILYHFASTSRYEVTFNNFSFHNFGDDSNLPIFPRKIPKAILILLTDRYDYLFFNGQSYLEDFNIRSLNFTLSPDPIFTNNNLNEHYWLSLNSTDNSTNLDKKIQQVSLAPTLDSNKSVLTTTYQSGSEPTRVEHGFRKILRTIVKYRDTYKLDKGLTWTDIYSNLTVTQYLNHKVGTSDAIINRLKSGEVTGVKLFHNTGTVTGAQANTTRLVSAKTWVSTPITEIEQEPSLILPDGGVRVRGIN